MTMTTNGATPGRTVSASVSIKASPQDVYALVTDLPRMGDWSPQNRGGRWVGKYPDASRGARFLGKNKNGWRSWATLAVVREAEAPFRFSFKVYGPLPVAEWFYEIEPEGDGCRVTETWIDRRMPGFRELSSAVTATPKDRGDYTRRDMERTLDAIKATAEL